MIGDSKNVFKVGTRVSIYKFDPAEIKIVSELNGRRELPDIEWLIKDIAEHGQLEPVIVRKDGERPTLVAGFSRWRAIMEINQRKLTPEPLEILATYFRGNEQAGFIAAVRENRFRNSTTPLDDATNISRMMAWNMEEKAIAAVYFPDLNGDQTKVKKALAWVRRTVKLVNLSPEAQQAVKEGRIKPSAAAHIAEMASDAQKELAKKQGAITASDVRAKQGKPERITVAKARDVIMKAATGHGLPTNREIPAWLRDWLEELAAKL